MENNLLVKGMIVIEKLAILGPQSIEDLYKETVISRSSIYRILCTLENLGYVIRKRNEAEDIWKLDLKFLSLSSHILSRIDLKTEIEDILIKLADDTKEIVQLGVLYEGKVLILDVIQRYKSLVSVAQVGELLDINICAAGLVLGAYLKEEELDLLLKKIELPKHTKFTITDPNRLKAELRKVRMRGYSFDNQYYAIAHRCIGAPVFDYTGRVIAAINISGHMKTISDEKIEELAEIVKQRAGEASIKMGYDEKNIKNRLQCKKI